MDRVNGYFRHSGLFPHLSPKGFKSFNEAGYGDDNTLSLFLPIGF